jgi:iron complex outermembrane receptor protein
LTVGVQRENYDKSVLPPDQGRSQLSDRPWRTYGTVAFPLTNRAILYAGYTEGLEDSGVAPNTAENRGAILPAARTWQADAGVRYVLTTGLNLIAGAFELSKPYYNFDSVNIDRELGQQKAEGVELSIAGKVTNGLSVIAGTVIGRVGIQGRNLATAGIGGVAFGQSHIVAALDVDYSIPWYQKWSVDFGATYVSPAPASVNDVLQEPSVYLLNAGARYRFHVLSSPATLRVQVQNITNVHIWNIFYSPGFFQYFPRFALAYLVVDI